MNTPTRQDIQNHVKIARWVVELRSRSHLKLLPVFGDDCARAISMLGAALEQSMHVIGDFDETPAALSEIANLLFLANEKLVSAKPPVCVDDALRAKNEELGQVRLRNKELGQTIQQLNTKLHVRACMALKIYEAARWVSINPASLTREQDTALWTEFRDVMGIPAGTATKKGVGAPSPGLF